MDLYRGDETGMFHPDAPVLYEQALKMVVAAEKGAHFPTLRGISARR